MTKLNQIIAVGYWHTVRFSGALPARRVNELTDRVAKLAEAVKFARETALVGVRVHIPLAAPVMRP